MHFGWPYPKRKARLDELVGTPSEKTQMVPFQGQDQYLKIYTVPIELPKYRLNNGRTYASQAEYLVTHPEVANDLFTKDWESEDAQRIQHHLLKEMIKEKNLLEYFKETKQAEALILSNDGFVINGNRRLCAMRELLEQDSQAYAHFRHVSVVVLPPAEEKDIDQLEATLQIKPDIKAEYTWYARALMLKRRRDEHNYKIDELVRLYHMDKGEIEGLIELLDYAEAYLADRGQAGQYHLLDKTEFAFRELRKSRSKYLKTESERACFDKLSYCMIDETAEGGRLYETIPNAAKHFDKIVDRIRDEFSLQPKPLPTMTGDVLALFGGEQQVNLQDVVEAISDKDKFKTVRDIVTDVVQSEKQKNREREKANFVLTQVKRANTALLDAANALVGNQERNGVAQQLQSIDSSLLKIKDWLNGGHQD